eukprot:COSAG02_NODE_4410_length_5388_cov_2.471167_6_plen_284_part_00
MCGCAAGRTASGMQLLFGVYNVVCQRALEGIPFLGFGLWVRAPAPLLTFHPRSAPTLFTCLDFCVNTPSTQRWGLSLPIIWVRLRGLPDGDRVQRVDTWRDAGLLVGVAASGFFGCSVLTLVALKLTSPPIFAISQCSSPMVTALVAWACGMERLGAVKLVGVVIGVAAAGYRISAKEEVTMDSESHFVLVGGVILIFLLCAAVYALLNKQINTKYNGATITAWGFCSATAFFALTAAGYLAHLAATAHQGSAADGAAVDSALQDELQLWWPLHWTTTQLCLL